MQKYFYGIVTILLGLMLGFYFQPLISGDNVYEQVRKFNNVLQFASKNYVDEVHTDKLVEAAIKGMLEELDPHSVYITAEDMKRVKEDFQGSFEGIGVEFDILNDTLTVVSPIPGGPSDSLGILAGDKIINIDGEDAIGIDRSEVPKKLKGPKGTIVKIDIKRSGEEELIHFDITRGRIPLNSVQTSFMMPDSDVGVIRISRFSGTTHREFVDSLASLRKMGLKRLILDLRGNPGGFLNQAFMMADEFLTSGNTIVYTKSRRPEFDETFTSSPRGGYTEEPLIVLIDAGSASASEIVSGAVQDLDRGLVMGVTSFGKGLVQRQVPLSDGSAFRMTISKYYTPSGRCIQRPYSDKKDYYTLVGRLDLDEGENMMNALDNIKHSIENDTTKEFKLEDDKFIITEKYEENGKEKTRQDTLPIYNTRSGRTVLGGGGITPDYIIKYDTITRLSRKFSNKNTYTLFVDSYMKSHGKELRTKYKANFDDFLRNYTTNDELLDEFKDFVESKEIEWNDEHFETDKDYIRLMIKANLARSIWNRTKFFEIYFGDDKMIKKAIKLFPQAEKIAKLK